MSTDLQFDLPSDGTAPAQARRVVLAALGAWRLPNLVDNAQLAVSELVSNAVRHGLPPVNLRLRRLRNEFRIEVMDASSEAGDLKRRFDQVEGHYEESGRGLAIVGAVANNTGAEAIPGRGKLIHASWSLPSNGQLATDPSG